MRVWLTGLVVTVAGVALTPVGPAQAVVTAPASVTLVSEAGDPVGGGDAELWRAGVQRLAFTGSPSGAITVEVSGGGATLARLDFEPPRSRELGLEAYTNAGAVPTEDFGALRVTRPGHAVCPETRGFFEVLEWSRDLSRLSILYQLECLTTGTTVFGEVSRGATSTTEVVGLPGQVRWPSAQAGAVTEEVPVTFYNGGTDPVEVGSVGVAPGGSFFSVTSHDCATLAANAACTAHVRYTPGASPQWRYVGGELTVTDTGGQPVAVVPLQGRSHVRVTGLDLSSQRGDWVGLGASYSFRPQDGTFYASGGPSSVEVRVSVGTGVWHALFDTGGRPFTAGTTYEVDSIHDPTGPRVDVSGGARGCEDQTGNFTIERADVDGQGLRSFAATFRQHCDGQPATLTGAVAWGADSMPAVPRPLPVGPVSDLATSPDLFSTLVSWTNPAVDTWTDTVVRMRTGRRAPVAVTDGTPVYRGRSGAVVVRDLTPGTDYSFGVFARDPDGVTGAPRTITVRGSHLSLTGPQHRLSKGQHVRLTARLTSASGAAVVGQHVHVFWRPGRTGHWKASLTRRTDGHGRVHVPHQLATRTGQYRAVYWGGDRRFGDTAGPVTVRVRK